MADDFKRAVRHYFEGEPRQWATEALDAYCHGIREDGQPLYTGGRFESFADGTRPDSFTATDMIAVSMLSVQVPARAVIRLVDDHVVDDLLSLVPNEAIWEVDESAIGKDSAAWRLWEALEELEDVGPVTAGKLMAAKRPKLIPIYDQHVNAALGPPRRSFWTAMRRSMIDAHELVEAVVEEAGVKVEPLRAVDVVVWMHQYGWQRTRRLPEPPPVGP